MDCNIQPGCRVDNCNIQVMLMMMNMIKRKVEMLMVLVTNGFSVLSRGSVMCGEDAGGRNGGRS